MRLLPEDAVIGFYQDLIVVFRVYATVVFSKCIYEFVQEVVDYHIFWNAVAVCEHITPDIVEAVLVRVFRGRNVVGKIEHTVFV